MTYKNFYEVVKKELKSLGVLVIYTFFLLLIQWWRNDHSAFEQILTNDFLNKAFIFSTDILFSIGVTGILIFIYALKTVTKPRVPYYFISTTFLDRVASISLGALGIAIPALLFIILLYHKLDNGNLPNQITFIRLFTIFFIMFMWLFGINLIFKFFSEEIKSTRKYSKKALKGIQKIKRERENNKFDTIIKMLEELKELKSNDEDIKNIENTLEEIKKIKDNPKDTQDNNELNMVRKMIEELKINNEMIKNIEKSLEEIKKIKDNPKGAQDNNELDIVRKVIEELKSNNEAIEDIQKNDMKNARLNDWFPVILAVLYIIFLLAPLFLIKLV